jgi:sulfur-oxidizing protein SoxZ
MATLPKPRIKVPDSVKAGEVIEIKTLISHVMETGQRREKDGKIIPRNIINTFTAVFEGNLVFKAELQPGISANPYIAFFMKVPGPGEIEFTWIDDVGARAVERVQLNVV